MSPISLKSILLLTGIIAAFICTIKLCDQGATWPAVVPFSSYCVMLGAWLLHTKNENNYP
jgi:hypothetical protein